ncbi:L-lactate permease [Epibacterium ulvae]|uniref:L-lactate permease n=1 Tax=Epibacterium ulvae TaxID=1156985 RepID=UPI002492382B|nr:L-lactate permease [Epibacterium ulvae]
MLTLVHMSPIFLTFTMLMVLRRPPVQAALAAVVLVAIIWALGLGVTSDMTVLSDVAKDTGVLFASTAAVIAPGLAFVVLVERSGANKALADWVQNLGWSRAQQVVFITLGLAPLLEAMTGFGVSLIATVPLLLALFARETAMRVALSGMVIMPWGTLGLATVVGAALAGLPATELGQASAIVSAPVFLMASGIALWLVGERGLGSWLQLIVSWVLFVSVLYAVSGAIGPEIAGVAAALCVLVLGLAVSFLRGRLNAWPKAAWPYLTLLVTIVALKVILFFTPVGQTFTLTGTDVSWQPLSSPGVALLLVIIMIAVIGRASGIADGLMSTSRARSVKPLLTIFFFLMLSQALLKGGFLASFQAALGQLSDAALAPVSAGLAGLSGYLTGSNVGGNAIFMPTIATLPLEGNTTLWLSAIQNSGAGHGAMGALSILALIAGLTDVGKAEEERLVRYGALLAVLNAILIAAVGSLLIYLGV